jgi:hypothetical protein
VVHTSYGFRSASSTKDPAGTASCTTSPRKPSGRFIARLVVIAATPTSSAGVAALANRAIGHQLMCIFVDNGVLRNGPSPRTAPPIGTWLDATTEPRDVAPRARPSSCDGAPCRDCTPAGARPRGPTPRQPPPATGACVPPWPFVACIGGKRRRTPWPSAACTRHETAPSLAIGCASFKATQRQPHLSCRSLTRGVNQG